ncbi:MAG TPA: hypothetical protein VIL04_08125 [Solirubrobacterales bacterium]|jgi:hypothetical protein
MSVAELAARQGLRDTRAALVRWNRDPFGVLRAWLPAALGFAAGLLTAVLVVASLVTADLTPAFIPGVTFPAGLDDYVEVLGRNGLVLALHAFACVAGFMAGSSLPAQAEHLSGWNRWIHERARPVAFAWVVGVTIFSLVTQAYVLGSTGAQLAAQFGISPAVLLLTVAPHALLELTAVFLPLAAWTIASRHGDWHELLAATAATVALAVPMLLVAASWETWAWPELLELVSPRLGG